MVTYLYRPLEKHHALQHVGRDFLNFKMSDGERKAESVYSFLSEKKED
jgi:hypothetical protein